MKWEREKKKKEWNSFAFVWIILVGLRHFLTLWLSRRDFQIFSLVCRLMRNLLRKDSASGLVPNLIYQKKKDMRWTLSVVKKKKKLILLIDFFSKFVVKMRRRMGTIVTFLNRYLIVCFVAGPRHLNDSNSSSFCWQMYEL